MNACRHLVFVLICSVGLVSGRERVDIGEIEMRLRSRSSTEPDDFLDDLMTRTVHFLDNSFIDSYSDTEYEFTQSGLSVLSHEVNGDGKGGYLADVELSANAVFQGNPVPEAKEVSRLVGQFFQTDNQGFLEDLMASSNPFLSNISYAIIRINADSEDDLENDPETEDEALSLDTWVIALIAGSTTFIVVLGICLFCLCCCGEEDGRNNNNDVQKVDPKLLKISRTASKTTAGDQDQDDGFSENMRSPSPVRSIMSQDSSKFTYNPKSVDGMTLSSFTLSSMDMDVEAWQQGSTISIKQDTIPFGQDISAIENKRDLSLIEEGDEDLLPTFSRSITDKRGSSRHQNDPEGGIRRSRSSGSSVDSSKYSLNLTGSADEVIKELNDLSAQVASFRGDTR